MHANQTISQISPSPTRVSQRAVRVLIGLTLLGVLARLAISWISLGSNDWVTWRWFGALALVTGPHAYELEPTLNHPPIPVAWSSTALLIASFADISFPLLFRLPALLADVGSCLLLQRIWAAKRSDARWGWLAAAAMSWNLAAMLIGAFHCNTDNVCAFFSFLAVHQLVSDRRPGRAGMALAAALNIKLVAILFIPLLLAMAWRQGRLGSIARLLGGLLPGFAIVALPFLMVPAAYWQNVFHYTPAPAEWGLMFLAMKAQAIPGYEMITWKMSHFYAENGRHAVIAAAGLIGLIVWRGRGRLSGYEWAALVPMAFLLLTPGFGIQYTVYAAPLLLAANLRWGVIYGVVAGLFAFACYYRAWDHRFPIQTLLLNQPNPTATWLGVLTWATLGVFVLSALTRLTNPVRQEIGQGPISSPSLAA